MSDYSELQKNKIKGGTRVRGKVQMMIAILVRFVEGSSVKFYPPPPFWEFFLSKVNTGKCYQKVIGKWRTSVSRMLSSTVLIMGKRTHL